MSDGTFDHESELPRVPLPTLEESGERLLAWCEPLLSAEDLARTRVAVDQLLDGDGPGPVLQAALAAYDADPSTHSWLDDFWEHRYLGRRDRIALNANFFFLFDDDRPQPPGQLERAAELILAALHHKHLVDTETLPPATRRGEPMSMEQHRYLFSATRIPGVVQDTARTPYTPEAPGPSPEHHILVFAHGRMAELDVIGPDGVAHTAAELVDGLRVVQALEPAPPGTALGHLTTMARAEWAAARTDLQTDPANVDALDRIERALFCVSLEDVAPEGDLEVGAQLLGGDSANRWFDKALTFIVFPDGTAGSNTEHCRLDGTTILALLDTMFATGVDAHAEALGARSQGAPGVRPIAPALTDGQRAVVVAAADDFARFVADQAGVLLHFDDVGSNRAKALGVSPDALCQLAYQLAHARARGAVGPTYESIATTQFGHGRTEAMRVVTPEIVTFVAAVDSGELARSEQRAALLDAAAAHGRRAADCRAGRAPEQHLWELSLLQARRGAELGATEPLAVVDSPGWHRLRNDHLSTSSAPSEHVRAFGFGSTGIHCIGVAYVLLPDHLIVHLSGPRVVEAELRRYADALRRAFADLTGLLESGD